MATRNIVPRATGEGSIGTSAKTWGAGYFDDIAVTNGITASTFTGDTDDTVLGVYGGTDYDKGAALQVFGKDSASYPGWFSLRASDGVNNKIFVGKPDGTFTWAGKNILTDATVGKTVTKSISSSVSLSASTAKTITSISLTAGTWVITGHCQYTTNTANRLYGVTIATSGNSYSYANDGSVVVHSSLSGTIALQTTVILVLASNSTVYLNGYATVEATVSSGAITAVRIV